MKPADGIEIQAPIGLAPSPGSHPTISLPQHVRLTAVEFRDQTDHANELVHERQWMLHPCEPLELAGNLFVFDDVLTGRGWAAMRLAPLPGSRQQPSDFDLRVAPTDRGGFSAELRDDAAYPWTVVEFAGGIVGRTHAVHRMQRNLFRNRDLTFLSNTWGDRSRDANMNEAFMLREINAAQRLGIEVVQLDDGWQRGRTSNSSEAAEANGRWEGFHSDTQDFWQPDPDRFPRGLEPLINAARSANVKLGLWYAPDSADDFACWRKDADTLLRLHQTYGVSHFKFDSINTRTLQGEKNLARLFDAVLTESDRQVMIDLDITAGCRPGYFGRIDCGPLFVANRYTDWHTYWPHLGLRMLWQLARWIDPCRLRVMFLNHMRNAERYNGDVLAPQNIPPATLFAPLLFAQPLGWFEVSELPENYFDEVRPLVDLWQAHRHAIHDGTVLPIGHAPNGVDWSGFMSLSADQTTGYLLLCNGMQESVELQSTLTANIRITSAHRLAGSGHCRSNTSPLCITGLAHHEYWFGTFELDPRVLTVGMR